MSCKVCDKRELTEDDCMCGAKALGFALAMAINDLRKFPIHAEEDPKRMLARYIKIATHKISHPEEPTP